MTGLDALALVENGTADMLSYGRLFPANPDLPARLAAGGPFTTPDRATFYGGDEHGYTDYPPSGEPGRRTSSVLRPPTMNRVTTNNAPVAAEGTFPGPAERANAMSFTEDEIAYLRSQPLARIATVAPDGQPDVVPVGFEFDGTYINIGGFAPAKTRRHHNVVAGNNKIALVIDDLASTQPWTPRYLRVYGTAEVIGGEQPYLRVTPEISWSWNLSGQPLNHNTMTPPHRTVHR